MYKAGFDYSWQEASFSLADEKGAILLEEYRTFPPRNASELPDWIFSLLHQQGATLEEVTHWSVGTGPGSFTGLRVAASLVMGFCFGREDVTCRGVSTACAMADSLVLAEDEKKVLVLFDGHRDELLGYSLARKDGGFSPSGFHGVIGKDSLNVLDDYEVLLSLEKDTQKILEVAGASAENKMRTVSHVSASRLIFNNMDECAPLTDPVYLRPAVFVAPRIPRMI